MNIDEVTGMPELPEGQFWRILPGHWNGNETMLVRLMSGRPSEVKSSSGYVTVHNPRETGHVIRQAPLMIPDGHTTSSCGAKCYSYGRKLEPTPTNFRLTAYHVLNDEPYSMIADHWGQPMHDTGLYSNQYKGDYPPRSMK